MHNKTLAELAQGLQSGEFSSVELTSHYLDRIKSLDEKTNAFITVTEEHALAQAKQADQLRADGKAGALSGIPIAHKDIFCTEGVKTSCGSKMLDNFIAPYESTVTQKCNESGLIMLGKTNMDEFAMGSSNESSFYGACHNPWDLDKIPGGSSGGSAAAVAARLAPIATGTDTGGSIRQPASMCNITGLKPTYGRVSRWGMIAFASSLDQAGPMAQTAEDAAMLLNVMAGLDLKDSTSMDQPVQDYTADLNNGLEGLRIGLPKEYFAEGLNGSVKAVIEASIKELEKQGAIIKEISLSTTNLSVPAYYVIAPAEASANLSRFDGVRYGYRCEDPQNLEDLYKRSRGEGFGDEVKRRIMIGAYALSAGYYDAYYKKAQQVRRLIKNDFANAFNEVDVIAGPTAPTTAFKMGEKTSDPVTMYLEDIFTISVNLAGLPAITVPAGFADGMPTGLQLIGNYFQEAKLLNIGHKYQQATDWHKKTPEQFA
ncbi:Asp-tRNA(Asn)/Glu-tRNA(Gln) amidotransferase subunit GatA [Litoribrevibacter albus]|uniref:Glutamyl-tRNA(Gln) amidotransferase subunit A n=1 Tax=Litoribrevibacter albus TaxID=1473156 RepID=A0AA37SA54_9GAMM|nr:Asp-tRNA(Asn)/Glu-tRNA(Gln) amidotransferase subunit GatA [Litoribrevibacter albus]GLQ31314.1 glutamyl-tRNA(Gln) amidotransferase subunit A [Litoribrevibacter albus]